MKKVVVFGGSGFLGSHIADQLTESGFQVVIFDKKKSQYIQNDQEMVVGDILDIDAVRNAIKNSIYVFDLAAIAGINAAQKNPVETVKVNILGTTYILDACREFNVKRFLFASTIYVYSEHGSFYRCSKQASELLIETYQKIYNLNYTILRYGSLYGPRANDFNFINNIIQQALLEQKIDRLGDGNELREYVHVLDAARASVKILDKEFINSNVMITGNKTTRVKDLLNMISEIMGNNIKINYLIGQNNSHYKITPYSFKPKVAKKFMLSSYHDLGQGILEIIYNTYKKLLSDGKIENNTIIKLEK